MNYFWNMGYIKAQRALTRNESFLRAWTAGGNTRPE